MADEMKPPVSGSTTSPLSPSSQSGTIPPTPSGPSPLTPDIKIPPNLPTGELRLPALPLLPKPPISFPPPTASQPLKLPPLSQPLPSQAKTPSTPPVPIVGLKPITRPPFTSQPGQSPPSYVEVSKGTAVFKSSIRTMQGDLAALQKGQTPAGFKIEKESEKDIKSTPEVTGPKVVPPSPLGSHVELGKLEKAKPLPSTITPPQAALKAPPLTTLPVGLAKPTIGTPPVGGILGHFKDRPDSKRIIIYVAVGIVGFVITAYLIPYFASLPTASVSPTPSATPTSTPTATPVSIESLFSIVDTVSISLGPNFTTRFIDSVITDPLLSSREPGIYKITSVDGIKRYGFTEFVKGIPVEIPDELKLLVDDSNLFLTLISKSDNKTSFGLIIKLRNPSMVNDAVVILQNWENTMRQTLTSLFQFDQTKAASVGFLDNTYNGTVIRYINFPDPNLTVDYSVIRAKNGESYLVIVNSREHIYAIIDKLK